MLITIAQVLARDEVSQLRARLETAPWQDGALTAGTLARGAKRNQQLEDGTELAIALGRHILGRLGNNARFIAAALPNRIYPPKFNRYAGGGTYGTHVDSALLPVPGTNVTVRSDLSATIFLSEPGEYEGGELQIEVAGGTQLVKLAAGDMVLYPSSTLHRVTPVTRGARIASFFWIESHVRDDGERALLHHLDLTIQALTPALPGDTRLVELTGIYHNLLRRWAST